MNPSSPSFLRLFRRSHYCRRLGVDEKSDTAEAERKERERFAVAALGFCLKHDRAFLKHFWECICHVPGDPVVMPVIRPENVLLEPPHWADLRVISEDRGRRFVWVVEVKIGARLDERQRPDRPSVFMQREYGYGALFAKEEKERGTKMRFVILGARPDDNLVVSIGSKKAAPIVLQQRNWAHLADGLPRTQLCKDLASCLGNLGIGAFPAADMKNMKANTQSEEIGKAVATLHDVKRRLDWPDLARAGTPSMYPDKGKWYMGWALNFAKASNPVYLKKVLQGPYKELAWFGYQGVVAGPTELAVWLNCGNNQIQQTTSVRLRKAIESAKVDEPPREKNWFGVIVRANKHRFGNDSDWFCSVFRALGLTVHD